MMIIEITKWVLLGIVVVVLAYSVIRVLSKGVFKSFFEARSEFNNKTKEEK